jgi:hypothetical protein
VPTKSVGNTKDKPKGKFARLGTASAATAARPLLSRQLCNLRVHSWGLGVRTVTMLRADAFCAVGPATPTEYVSSLAQLFIASWIRTRT